MVQVRARGITLGAQAFAMAVVVAALMSLAALGGYEFGSSRVQPHSQAAQLSTMQPATRAAGTTQDAPPVSGFQP